MSYRTVRRGFAIFAVTIGTLTAVGCSQSDSPEPKAPGTTSTQASSTAASATTASTTAEQATSAALPNTAWSVVDNTIATGCAPGRGMPRTDDEPGQTVVLNVTNGEWDSIPSPRAVKETEEGGATNCVIAGDPKNPAVVYSATVTTKASGVTGEGTRGELYAMKVRGGSASDAVDLTSVLTPNAEAIAMASFPGGFYVLESDLTHRGRGLKIVSLDADLKPTVKTIVQLDEKLSNTSLAAPQLSGDYPNASISVALNGLDTIMWNYLSNGRGTTITRLPGGEPISLKDPEGDESAAGRFLIYENDAQTFPDIPVRMIIRDVVSGKTVTTPFDSSGSAARVQVWGDVVMLRNCYAVNMATGRVLLDRCSEKNLASNMLAGKYLYVQDGLKNPVIDLETGTTVAQGWAVRPVTRIPGWTVVAQTSGLDNDKAKLVRDDAQGNYPGPWW